MARDRIQTRKNKKFHARVKNNYTYNIYYNMFRNIITNLFKWEGLPNNIQSRWIEHLLFYYGECGFTKNNEVGEIVCQIVGNNKLNYCNEHTYYNFYTNSSIITNFNVARDKMVLIRNDFSCTPSNFLCNYMTDKFYNIERCIDKNLFQLKRPIIVNCEEGQRLTIERLFEEIDENQEIIYGSKALDKDIEDLKILNLNPQYNADKLKDLEKTYFNDFCTMLGINNSNIDKRERVNQEEVNSNNELILANRLSLLEPRLQACEEFKAMGYNVTVDYNPKILGMLHNLGGANNEPNNNNNKTTD